ncbi:MAG: ASKHA domain-containing protein [Thermodesulfovibrionales bacterium]|nr:ASKHA domain-containing protein [Thermodesulfovibrionales bacterium]
MKPLVSSFQITLSKPSPSDKTADYDRLIMAISKNLDKPLPVFIDLKSLQILPIYLRKKNFSIKLAIAYTGTDLRILDLLEVYNDSDKVYGVAIDIGTTNVVGSLFETDKSYQKLAYCELENPQILLGLDVLTRVQHAILGKSVELNQLILKGINELIKTLCRTANIEPSKIYMAVFAGNTIMSHFLLNLSVENIPIEPYIPVCNRFQWMKAKDLGIDIHPNGIVYVFPNAGSYVGGDIIAGILSTGLYKEELPSLLIDVGTNAEIVFGCKEWILVGAGAAGPALESGISDIGMRAVEGAIYSIEIDNHHGVKFKTIGSKPPKGICGSGMIELISEMFKAGIIDNQGKFRNFSEKVIDINGKKGFLIYDTKEKTLIITNTDIENFLRSKAAMFTSLYVIVKSVGLTFKDIDKVYISGAFGKGIDAQKAIQIGMIPNIEKNKFIPLENSSLRGAEMLLMNRDLLEDIEKICNLITYKEMNTESEFMKEFPGALFIPHTNPSILNT